MSAIKPTQGPSSASAGSSDVAVVGGGVAGLACAMAAARRGLSVALFERSARAAGASVRNFGMVLPGAQPPGPRLEMALRSRERWLELARVAGFGAEPVGLLYAVHHEDELGVLEEFADRAPAAGYRVSMLTPDQAAARSPWLRREGLLGAMLSHVEVQIDPRQAIARLTDYAAAALGVSVHHRACVTDIDEHGLTLAGGVRWRAERVCVCSGDDVRTLYPDVHAAANIELVKLQMMRTAAQMDVAGARAMGPMLAFGSTLRWYAAFSHCPSVARVKARFAAERPEFDRWGIHVMASQTPLGEITIGDSHEHGEPSPFTRADIDQLILDYLHRHVALPDPTIRERWFGVYAKRMDGQPWLLAAPKPNVRVLNGLGGGGMTLSLALAEDLFANW